MRKTRRAIAALAVLGALVALAGTASAQRGRHGRLFPPEDLGILEGPDRDAWQKPEQIMDALGIADGATVADLGAGGGWFTVRLARRVGPTGLVYAEDVQPQMIESIRRRVEREGLKNVQTVHGTAIDPRLPPSAVDAVLIVETYNELEDPVALLRNVARALKPRGRLGIVEFKSDGLGPGPPPEERVDEQRILAAAAQAGLQLIKRETFLRYNYMLVFGPASS
ncbi:MAG: class I SAM-dependent methyltransferase [Acidobacteriota bacterium]